MAWKHLFGCQGGEMIIVPYLSIVNIYIYINIYVYMYGYINIYIYIYIYIWKKVFVKDSMSTGIKCRFYSFCSLDYQMDYYEI